jgi:hypothetical protein
MYVRVLANALHLPLSAWYLAGMINNWVDKGGWSQASLNYAVEHGIPELSYCPKYSKKYDTPEAANNATFHRVEEWWDGSDNPNKAQAQLVSMLLKRVPCVCDVAAMGHSMVAIDLASVSPVEVIYDNSWGDHPDKGLYYGRGAYALPQSLVCPRVAGVTDR